MEYKTDDELKVNGADGDFWIDPGTKIKWIKDGDQLYQESELKAKEGQEAGASKQASKAITRSITTSATTAGIPGVKDPNHALSMNQAANEDKAAAHEREYEQKYAQKANRNIKGQAADRAENSAATQARQKAAQGAEAGNSGASAMINAMTTVAPEEMPEEEFAHKNLEAAQGSGEAAAALDVKADETRKIQNRADVKAGQVVSQNTQTDTVQDVPDEEEPTPPPLEEEEEEPGPGPAPEPEVEKAAMDRVTNATGGQGTPEEVQAGIAAWKEAKQNPVKYTYPGGKGDTGAQGPWDAWAYKFETDHGLSHQAGGQGHIKRDIFSADKGEMTGSYDQETGAFNKGAGGGDRRVKNIKAIVSDIRAKQRQEPTRRLINILTQRRFG